MGVHSGLVRRINASTGTWTALARCMTAVSTEITTTAEQPQRESTTTTAPVHRRNTTTEIAAVAASTTTVPVGPWHVEDRVYYFPVQPTSTASYGAAHHDYPATDIFAAEGSILVAVTHGVIDEVGTEDNWDPDVDDPATRGGLYVSIIGDDGVRYYYSHLGKVDPGVEASARVDAGQVIGEIGRTGNARETSAHVHFGISHPTYAGDWGVRRGEVSPYPYLKAWEDGEDVSPVLASS